jgi:transposase
MYPNANFARYFPDAEIPETEVVDPDRSSCLRVGAYLVIKQIIEEYGLPRILEEIIPGQSGLFLDIAAYTIISENNAGQYYPDYAYNHPLFTADMRVYSDSKVSRFLHDLKRDQSIEFQTIWNEKHGSQDQIYVSYDSTNKNCQSGDIDLVEIGHPKDNKHLPVLNFAVAYDTSNSLPIFYEEYSGSIVDVSQLQYMISKAQGYHYKNLCFILDRGYFSEPNIRYMENCGYDFIIMMKGMKSLVKELVLKVKGTFEEDYSFSIPEYHTNGITIKAKLFETDKVDRYFHIYYKDSRKAAECEKLYSKIDRIAEFLEQHEGKVYEFEKAYEKYFSPSYSPENPDVFLCATTRNDAITQDIKLCGYFVIITSKKMTAAEALKIYKSRDASEKLFRGDKSYLGNNCYRVHGSESLHAKIFIEFVALIIRNKIYSCLKNQAQSSTKKKNYMNVVAALKELEKIELIRHPDGAYQLDHAVTATQKEILKAFGMTAASVREKAMVIGQQLESLYNKEEQ